MNKPLCAWCLNEYSEEPFCCEKMDYENTKIKLAEAREEKEWCGNFSCGNCYDCKCHQIGIMLSRNEDLEKQLAEARDEKECLRMLLLNWSGLLQSDIENELKKFKGE